MTSGLLEPFGERLAGREVVACDLVVDRALHSVMYALIEKTG